MYADVAVQLSSVALLSFLEVFCNNLIACWFPSEAECFTRGESYVIGYIFTPGLPHKYVVAFLPLVPGEWRAVRENSSRASALVGIHSLTLLILLTWEG